MVRNTLLSAFLLLPMLVSAAGSVTINGQTIIGHNNGSIVIRDGKIFVNGKDVTPESKEINVVIHGDVGQLNCSGCTRVTVNGNAEDIDTASGDVNVSGNVTGKVSTMSGDVTVRGNQSGGVKTMSGDIRR